MRKKLIFALLLLPYGTIFCMQDVVINFEDEEDTKIDIEFDADELTNLSANEVDLESGLGFKDFYNKKRIK